MTKEMNENLQEREGTVEILPSDVGNLPAGEAVPLLNRAASRIDIVKPRIPFWEGIKENLRGAAGWIEAHGSKFKGRALNLIAGASLASIMVSACAKTPETPYLPPTEPVVTQPIEVPIETATLTPTPTETPEAEEIIQDFDTRMGEIFGEGRIKSDIVSVRFTQAYQMELTDYGQEFFKLARESDIKGMEPMQLLIQDRDGNQELIILGKVRETEGDSAVLYYYLYTDEKDGKFVPVGDGEKATLLPLLSSKETDNMTLRIAVAGSGEDSGIYGTIFKINLRTGLIEFTDPYSGKTLMMDKNTSEIAMNNLFSMEEWVLYLLPWGCKKTENGWEQAYVKLTRQLNPFTGEAEDVAAICDIQTGTVPLENYQPSPLR